MGDDEDSTEVMTKKVYHLPLKPPAESSGGGGGGGSGRENDDSQHNSLTGVNSMDESSTDFEGTEGSDVDFSDSDIDESSSLSKNCNERLTDTEAACLNFAMEHRIFLKAILGLLADRDNKATEIGMNDPNTLKSGPLKKASHLVKGVWKVKFVELRRGMFSYYDDTLEGSSLRKNIPLDSNLCSCRPVKIHNMAVTGAIFELTVGTTRRLWLTKSKAERRGWIEAINEAWEARSCKS